MRIYFGWKKCAGLVCFWFVLGGFGYTFHFFVQKEHWVWGRSVDYYNGPIDLFGIGPLFLFCRDFA